MRFMIFLHIWFVFEWSLINFGCLFKDWCLDIVDLKWYNLKKMSFNDVLIKLFDSYHLFYPYKKEIVAFRVCIRELWSFRYRKYYWYWCNHECENKFVSTKKQVQKLNCRWKIAGTKGKPHVRNRWCKKLTTKAEVAEIKSQIAFFYNILRARKLWLRQFSICFSCIYIGYMILPLFHSFFVHIYYLLYFHALIHELDVKLVILNFKVIKLYFYNLGSIQTPFSMKFLILIFYLM